MVWKVGVAMGDFNKDNFLKSDLYEEIVFFISQWEDWLCVRKNTLSYQQYYIRKREAEVAREKWYLIKNTFKYFTGIDLHFIRTCEYYGIFYDREGKDAMFKIYRELV